MGYLSRLLVVYLALHFSHLPSTFAASNEQERLTQAYAYVAYPQIFDGLIVNNLETPIQFRALLYVNLATYNAWCNYHPTAADIFGRTRSKQPPSEFTTENKNTAILYALLRVYEASPQSYGGASGLPKFRELFQDRGLDPFDTSIDTSSPIGVGNREGFDTARLAAVDKWNDDGLRTATQPLYALPFQDYSEYTPRNTPWSIRFPFRWQPLLETNGVGFFFRQEHVVPFAGDTLSFTITPQQLNRRRVKSPYIRPDATVKTALGRDWSLLRREARQVFKTSRKLTEKQRLLAELFDSKFNAFKTQEDPFGTASIAAAVRFFILGPALDFSLDREVIYGLAANIASFDAMIAVWREKRRQDAIRPTGQTMNLLFGNQTFTVAGAPYEKPVVITAGEWQPYIRTMPHSEFPSASACTCSAIIEHALVVTGGRDEIPYNVTILKGSSKFASGFPREDVTIPINRLSEWSQLCGVSRLWAGVHFEPAVEAGKELCAGIGERAEEVVQSFVAGKGDMTWLSWLEEGTDRFWEN